MDTRYSYPGPLQKNNLFDHLELFELCFSVSKQGETMNNRWAQKEEDWFRRYVVQEHVNDP